MTDLGRPSRTGAEIENFLQLLLRSRSGALRNVGGILTGPEETFGAFLVDNLVKFLNTTAFSYHRRLQRSLKLPGAFPLLDWGVGFVLFGGEG